MFTPTILQFRPCEVFLEHNFLAGPLASGLSPTLNSFRVDTCFISPILETCVWLKVVLKSVFVEDSNQLMSHYHWDSHLDTSDEQLCKSPYSVPFTMGEGLGMGA